MNEVYVDNNNQVRVTARYGEDHDLGELVAMEDGYYQFFPHLGLSGYWATGLLRDIADLVDKRNQEWAATILREVGDNPET